MHELFLTTADFIRADESEWDLMDRLRVVREWIGRLESGREADPNDVLPILHRAARRLARALAVRQRPKRLSKADVSLMALTDAKAS